ncbi:MAG: glycoside hydrolase family 5 protein [Clostridia bacterium]|nr:glycoside hydrolase family 5 protein [Clostridia bacterium]
MKKSLSLLLALCLLLTLFASAAQAEVTIPDLTITRRPIPENEAMDFLKSMGVGWNLGNTFDAIKGSWNRNADEMTVETSWVGIKTTEAMIEAIQNAGFSSIRVPISWHDHVSGPDHEISEKWLNRVQEVVDWAYNRGMYVIINIHHDEDQFLPASSHYEESAHYVECVWRQLAERFRDYDEHLIMESMNEPRLVNTAYEWTFNPSAPECVDAADCLNRLNQLFVDTVRASGGNNATRYLMVPAYDAAPGNAVRDSFLLPTDSADNKIIVSAHAYTPYDFTLNQNGGNTFGTQNQKADIVGFMNSLYNQYIVNGIPVVIGEYGAMVKGDNLQDRVDWAAFYVASASARNLPCLYWDNNVFSGNGERFGLLDRKSLSFPHQVMVDAIMRYAGWDNLPEAQ